LLGLVTCALALSIATVTAKMPTLAITISARFIIDLLLDSSLGVTFISLRLTTHLADEL
jgi:hypothetical protein